jgi:hypothetical protein
MTRSCPPNLRSVSEGLPSIDAGRGDSSAATLALVASPAVPPKRIEKVDPLLISISHAGAISGLSRSEIYRRMAAGNIRAVKCGSRTLIVMESFKDHLKSLPTATFHVPR